MFMTDTANKYLSGWKEIAKYFGVSVSTIKRKAKKFKMPIDRLPGGNKPIIHSKTADNWLKNKNG